MGGRRSEVATSPSPAPHAVVGAGLRLGPHLRHVGERDATIWVETDRACHVEVVAGTARASDDTFEIAGHHYSLVVLDGLAPATRTAYEVRLDGRLVWPYPDSPYPPSLIRTIDPNRPFRLMFGSCRSWAAKPVTDVTGSGQDALGACARRMMTQAPDAWPDALLTVGDQVYADETSDDTRRYIRSRRDPSRPPGNQVADFEEYTHIYAETWSDPDVRWLFSTLPTSMIFDDHDVIDDWNTSRSWRNEMLATDWWLERITGALMSYWIYQHLGNLSPERLRTDEWYRAVREANNGGATLRALAQAADREADGGRGVLWSYRRDFGRARLLVIDSRAGRVLTEGARQMVGDREFSWIEAQVEDGEYDHLLVATSMPWLLPRALHDAEAGDEALCAGSRGRSAARVAEQVRRAVDLEHWAAFNDSFERLARLFRRLGRGEHGKRPPATICVLSGDVHHSYVLEAMFGERFASRVYQLTCSPFHNSIPLPMRLVFRAAWSRFSGRLAALLLRLCRAPAPSFGWRTEAGPFFGNYVATISLHGRAAEFSLDKPAFDGPVTRATPVPEARRQLSLGERDGKIEQVAA
jgi:phosphodiesterase/alkaline phosphatase D-like protein